MQIRTLWLMRLLQGELGLGLGLLAELRSLLFDPRQIEQKGLHRRWTALLQAVVGLAWEELLIGCLVLHSRWTLIPDIYM